MKPVEFEDLEPRDLRQIVLMEARAAPRLQTVEGLWRKSTKTRPGRMTDFIAANGLLPENEISDIQTTQLLDLERFLDNMAGLPLSDRTPLRCWLEKFDATYNRTRRSLAA